MIKQIMNQMTVQEVKRALSANEKFMRFEDGFLSSTCFREQVIAKTEELGMSVNEIVAEYLNINGCL